MNIQRQTHPGKAVHAAQRKVETGLQNPIDLPAIIDAAPLLAARSALFLVPYLNTVELPKLLRKGRGGKYSSLDRLVAPRPRVLGALVELGMKYCNHTQEL